MTFTEAFYRTTVYMHIAAVSRGRQQVLAGRRQGQELDLLGSFPSDSGCFQHPPPTSQHRDGERKRNKRCGVREERGKQREEGCKG